MHKLCEYIDMELDELEDKVKRGGKLTTNELEYGKDLAKFKMALLTNKAMEDEGYSETYYPRGSYGRKRDSMGRYSRDSFLDELRKVADKAPDEKHKRAIHRMIEDIESE